MVLWIILISIKELFRFIESGKVSETTGASVHDVVLGFFAVIDVISAFLLNI